MTTNNYKAELDLAVALHEVAVKERDLARAQLRDARADLREAMELLRAYGQPHYLVGLKEAIGWNASYRKLMEKHKERP